MSVTMRAKMRINNVEKWPGSERLTMAAVCKNEPYSQDGSDENNTFAKFTPSADLSMTIANPALVGKFEKDQEFYVDFIPVEPQA